MQAKDNGYEKAGVENGRSKLGGITIQVLPLRFARPVVSRLDCVTL
jgi:hypothetical protein